MRKRAILLIYGEGGHRAQMKRLHQRLAPDLSDRGLEIIGICEGEDSLPDFMNYSQGSIRSKHSSTKTFLQFPLRLLQSIFVCCRILWCFKIVSVVSTGPGICILPSVLFKIIGSKVVFFESWSRFETRSLTGRFMYRIADRFYVQNRGMVKLYPNAVFGGRL